MIFAGKLQKGGLARLNADNRPAQGWSHSVSAKSGEAQAKIFPVCGRSLRAWIVIAVQRMRRQHRLGSKDVSIAEESVTKFVELLKREAGDYPDQMRMWEIFSAGKQSEE